MAETVIIDELEGWEELVGITDTLGLPEELLVESDERVAEADSEGSAEALADFVLDGVADPTADSLGDIDEETDDVDEGEAELDDIELTDASDDTDGTEEGDALPLAEELFVLDPDPDILADGLDVLVVELDSEVLADDDTVDECVWVPEALDVLLDVTDDELDPEWLDVPDSDELPVGLAELVEVDDGEAVWEVNPEGDPETDPVELDVVEELFVTEADPDTVDVEVIVTVTVFEPEEEPDVVFVPLDVLVMETEDDDDGEEEWLFELEEDPLADRVAEDERELEWEALIVTVPESVGDSVAFGVLDGIEGSAEIDGEVVVVLDARLEAETVEDTE